ncbi:hypothetical protein [Streptomyces hiroshimensis]|uniref:Head-to-tail stopper n=1 Tax=Streptomyces hiroshimensis TaxID=66424 RepID=A0ABQ2Y408_9ACTN|nr:hypothetical protein [Streptomyces hiroshimensis]GGX63224.1 hypothetical protein GCM10010324_04970 [Streptomyces hiroshimensis]
MIVLPAPAFGEAVTVLRPGPAVLDIYGNDAPGPDQEHPLHGCVVAPEPGAETVGGQDIVTDHLVIYAPAESDVRPTDRLRVRGDVFSVHGPVQDFRSPLTGTRAGVQVTARRVTG